MRLLVLSDLHLEYAPYQPSQVDVDAVVLAGDISEGVDGILWAKSIFKVPVIYVCGNHEYHNNDFSMKEHMAAMKTAAAESNVTLLDNEVKVFDGVRILGTTMWTDLGEVRTVLPCDYDYIIVSHEPSRVPIHFTVDHQQMLFERNRKWLYSELAKPFFGKSVVVTHHAPSHRSLHPQHTGNPYNDCFITDMESLMPEVDLWVHGHTHNNFDYQVGRTRVVCNPRGYPHPLGGWENRAFDPEFIVEI